MVRGAERHAELDEFFGDVGFVKIGEHAVDAVFDLLQSAGSLCRDDWHAERKSFRDDHGP